MAVPWFGRIVANCGPESPHARQTGGLIDGPATMRTSNTPPGLTDEVISALQQSWVALQPSARGVAVQFYIRLFQAHPEYEPLFNVDFQAQAKKLTDMIDLLITRLPEFDQMVPALQEMGQRHVDYGVKPEMYPEVARILVETFASNAGPAFDEQLTEIWLNLLQQVSQVMLEQPGTS